METYSTYFILGFILEGVGALGCFMFPMITIMTWNKYFLMAGIVSFIILFGGFFLTLV